MGSAIGNVLGGGGGGLLGSIGGIVGGIFGGPLGSMIGQAVGGMLQQAIGGGMESAINTLVKEHGMPKFLGEQVKGAIGNVINQLHAQSQNGVPGAASDIAKEKFGDAVNQFQKDFAQSIVDGVVDAMRGQGDSGKTSKGNTGGGWLQAIARVMGEALGNKAKEMVKLSGEISNVSKNKSEAPKGSKDQEKQADLFNQKMTEFQATSQEFSYLNSVFTTAIKGLGEALSSMARKQ